MPTYTELLEKLAGTDNLVDYLMVDPDADSDDHVMVLHDSNSLASCHPQAEFLSGFLGGDPLFRASDAEGIRLAGEALAKGGVLVHFQYALRGNRNSGHSFVLIARPHSEKDPQSIECLEAWANRDSGFQLHDCFQRVTTKQLGPFRRDSLVPSEVFAAVALLADKSLDKRTAGMKLVSRLPMPFFGDDGKTDMQMDVSGFQLVDFDTATRRITERARKAGQWLGAARRQLDTMRRQQAARLKRYESDQDT